jgi:23S rRNA (cytidine1920-2'-O)/16S rRNA (cytidine1409-2'-O)-methyltransferase
MATSKGIRLDERLVRDGIARSLGQAQGLVMSGQVVVGEHRADKAGTRVADDMPVRLKSKLKAYVSRAGDKLAGALAALKPRVLEQNCLDIGASTGGFTDCLLKHGAAAVCAVDVGHGLLDGALRNDPRITLLERRNAKHLTAEQLPWVPALITVDVSFIAARALLPPLTALSDANTQLLVMVKPQFELPRARVPIGGVVTDPKERQNAAALVAEAAVELGWHEVSRCDSTLAGHAGNRELFLLLDRHAIDDCNTDDNTNNNAQGSAQ